MKAAIGILLILSGATFAQAPNFGQPRGSDAGALEIQRNQAIQRLRNQIRLPELLRSQQNKERSLEESHRSAVARQNEVFSNQAWNCANQVYLRFPRPVDPKRNRIFGTNVMDLDALGCIYVQAGEIFGSDIKIQSNGDKSVVCSVVVPYDPRKPIHNL